MMTSRGLLAATFASLAATLLVAQTQSAADWQTKAGGKMAFEVASVKPSKGAFVPPEWSLSAGDDYRATGGHFRADFPLSVYIDFAYKLWPNEPQRREFSHLPKWVFNDRYSIEARSASGSPTKDQMRLMVQSLLADRFQLTAHFDAREVPVFDLKLAKNGAPGPQLVDHANGPACDKPSSSPGDGLPGFPADCHTLSAISRPGTSLFMAGARDVTMDVLVGALSGALPLSLGRPVIDKTGLTGSFDFMLQWAPEPRTATASDSPVPAPTGPTPLEALRDQLGLKLEPARASLPILVIDRVERPSEN